MTDSLKVARLYAAARLAAGRLPHERRCPATRRGEANGPCMCAKALLMEALQEWQLSNPNDK